MMLAVRLIQETLFGGLIGVSWFQVGVRRPAGFPAKPVPAQMPFQD